MPFEEGLIYPPFVHIYNWKLFMKSLSDWHRSLFDGTRVRAKKIPEKQKFLPLLDIPELKDGPCYRRS